jgi:hypothetical protein
MNKTMQKVALLMLSMVSACVAEVGPPPDEEPAPSVAMAAPSVPVAAAPRRDGGPFSRTVREQLAARGIHVHDGSTPPQGERTTVEQEWIVPGYPMSRITQNDPTTVPLRYTTQLGIRWPRYVQAGTGAPYIDPSQPGEKGSCSGTVVGTDAVLTAAHCVTNWLEIGNDLTTGAPVKRKVQAYAIKARPRRNGNSKPHGEFNVRKSYWPFSSWPAATAAGYPIDHDYAIMRLATPPALPIPATTVRSVATPPGTSIEFGHYPMAFERQNAGLYYSAGDIDTTGGGLYLGMTRVYRHRASMEPGSSGAGVFEFGVDGVAGVISSEDARAAGTTRRKGQTKTGFPNQVLMFTPTEVATINGWIALP